MQDVNNIKCTLGDAWKEFERTGEITNSSENMLLAVEALLEENEELKLGLFLHNKMKEYPDGSRGYNQAKQELDNILVKYNNGDIL